MVQWNHFFDMTLSYHVELLNECCCCCNICRCCNLFCYPFQKSSFWSGLGWYRILISLGNGKHWCRNSARPQRKGQRSFTRYSIWLRKHRSFIRCFCPDQRRFTHYTPKFFSPFHPDHGNFTLHNQTSSGGISWKVLNTHTPIFTYRYPIWRLIRYLVDLILSVLLMWMFVCCGLPLMFFWLQTCITIMGNNWWAPCPPNCARAWFVRRHLNNAGQPVPADDTWHTNKGNVHARCVICEHLLTLTE